MAAITIGIAGITGRFARRLVAHLQGHDVVIRGYCRDASKFSASPISLPQVQITQGDAFDATAVRPFVKGCNVVVCCYLGDDKLMVDGQKMPIDSCEEANVPRYIASDWALDYTKLKLGQLFPKDPVKHVKAYLDTKKKKNVKGVHILIGGFMEPFFSPFFNIWDPVTTTFRYWGEGDEVWEGTTYDNPAEYTAAVALDANATGIQRFLGDRATIQQIAESFENVYGVKPRLERLGSLHELYKKMHELRAKYPTDMLKYMSMFFMYYWINGQTFVGPELDNSKYPDIKPVSWEDFMKTRTVDQLPGAFNALAGDFEVGDKRQAS